VSSVEILEQVCEDFKLKSRDITERDVLWCGIM
jgi:hypothetical protein